MKALFTFLGMVFLSMYPLHSDNLKWVDPMIGTGGIGHTYPGATVPFGMLQVSPTNEFKAWNWCSGYHYSDSTIKGFAHNFVSGAGLAALGDILLMPTDNKEIESLADIAGYDSRFSHDREIATPGYYSMYLDDYSIKVELTANERMGCHRYTYDNGGYGNVIIDPGHGVMEGIIDSGVMVKDSCTVLAYKKSNGAAGLRTVSAYIRFSRPFDTYREGKAGYVSFNGLDKGERVEVKVTLSYVDSDGAEKNYLSQDSSLDFKAIHEYAKSEWRNVLDRFDVKSRDTSFLRSFYTSVYHCFLAPNLISDVDGRYTVEGKVYSSEIPQYSNYSTWDTFRALHPLFTLVEHGKTTEFVNSLVSRYDCGLDLPVWECLGFDNVCMIGQNTIPVISEAILKGIDGIDVEKAYLAMRTSVNNTTKHSPNFGWNNNMKDYIVDGFVCSGNKGSVSKTMEYNYFDWCLGQVAEKLGMSRDYLYFTERSLGHLNHFDQETGYFLPVDRNGRMERPDKFDDWNWLQAHYVSGNIWGYSTFTPHNMEQIFRLHGGKEKYVEWLDGIFTDTQPMSGTVHVDISGFIGKYGHGDEPSQQAPYLFTMAGAPEKTSYYVRETMDRFYKDTPDGLVNNDDFGQMSAWYIFSALGFYPVNPCSCEYVIGIPAAERFTMKLANGHEFTVKTEGFSSDKHAQIDKVYLNGIELTSPYIRHEDIMKGGELLFVFKIDR